MSRLLGCFAFILALHSAVLGAPKPHSVAFGKWTSIKWMIGPNEDQPIDLKIRPLLIDGHIKEYTIGVQHDITERLFVVRRVFRVNDALPDDKATQTHWRWERGGWLMIDRVSTHITQINLPEFDSYSSVASWYRDYVAYCGVYDDGAKFYEIVTQLGRRKPVLKKTINNTVSLDMPDSACAAPDWQRQPIRVSFSAGGSDKTTYEVRGHSFNLIKDEDEDESGSE
ncbi:MAG TPA: hypothetical protein VLK33_22010 [Terriglobales bacterium]|nr:hypothetical protein [Terriglobales bacterium]